MYFIGVDLGGTNIAAGIVDETGKVIYKDAVETLKEREFEDIAKEICKLCLRVIEKANLKIQDISSIGIGSPGLVDSINGKIIYANNLKFRNVEMREEIKKYVDVPVFVENDANCAALAESVAGAAKGTQHSVTITIGTGIGSGVIVDGKIYNGFNGAAAELGHTYLVYGGNECTCGKRGCWEAYSSATAIIKEATTAVLTNPKSLINDLSAGDVRNITAKIVFDAAGQGDIVAQNIIEQYIKYLAAGLVNVINIFQPEVIVIGGGVSNQREKLLSPLKGLVDKELFEQLETHTALRIAEMGNDAGIVGAAMLGKV